MTIVFDEQATFEGKRLYTESLQGPKLESDMSGILMKSRKEPVALAGDVSQMYHQLFYGPKTDPCICSSGEIWIKARSLKSTNSRVSYLVGVIVLFVLSTHA